MFVMFPFFHSFFPYFHLSLSVSLTLSLSLLLSRRRLVFRGVHVGDFLIRRHSLSRLDLGASFQLHQIGKHSRAPGGHAGRRLFSHGPVLGEETG